MILCGERGIHAFGGNMASTHKLSDYYSIGSRIEIKEEDSYYSRLELAVTGLSSDSAVIPGIQARIYSGLRNSLIADELAGYPAETVIRIGQMSEDYAAQVFENAGKSQLVYNVRDMYRLSKLMDTTASSDFKLFAGNDGRRWDFTANMDAKKAVLYVKNSVNPMIIMRYLMPFVPEQIRRRYIASTIEKKHKAGRS